MRALLKHFVAFPPVESLGGNILVDDLLATVPAYEAARAAHLLPLQCTCYLPQFYEVATVRQPELVEIER